MNDTDSRYREFEARLKETLQAESARETSLSRRVSARIGGRSPRELSRVWVVNKLAMWNLAAAALLAVLFCVEPSTAGSAPGERVVQTTVSGQEESSPALLEFEEADAESESDTSTVLTALFLERR